MAEDQDKKISYKNTLNLPKTDFPIRSNPKVDDQLMLERWQQEDLYRKTFFAHQGKQKYILHDGPPYANGNIHLGHALNKVLKDIVGKSQRMMEKQVPITPGWDCHGLPIELKVSTERPGLSRSDLKKASRAYAQKWVNIQREEFKQLGVLMDWDDPYLTMGFSYEASVVKAFGIFVDKGYIERKNKTVPWCPSCQTVLAAAEIEYEERKDPSVYTLFALTPEAQQRIVPEIKDQPVNLLVWTTTPWTLPLNRAVLLKPNADYVVLDINGQYIITAQNLADDIAALKDAKKHIVATFNTRDLPSNELKVQHPLISSLQVPIILDDSVSLDDGTAAVHSAPGCGPEDYEVGVKNDLEIFSPISPEGSYTQEIQPSDLNGMPVSEGQWWVLRKIKENGQLFHKANIRHSYPHCWRCHGGLIYRATKQWFCDLSKHDLKQRVLQAIDEHIQTIPEKSINRLKATVQGRLEWCLSRQRVWGVPIPAVIHDKTDFVYTSKELADTVARYIAQEGIEWWEKAEIKDLLPENFDFKSYPLDELRKEQDILDVWFESGVSYFAVLLQNKNLGFPADIYLEGKDQHRAWFQSSLLSSMVTEDKPPMKLVMTHGFTVDEKGRKMSKSIGNVVAPKDMIDSLGTDGLRLWVSSIDESGEAIVSEVLVKNVKEVFRKIRNTCRFLLSNLYDFDIDQDAVPSDALDLIDVHGLHELYKKNKKIIDAYNQMDFTAVFHMLGDYAAVDLSSFYLDIIKDRLYVEQAHGHKRRSAQTACWYILDTMTRLIAPILSFTAEQLSDHYQKNKSESIHLQTFNDLSSLDNLTQVADQQEQLWYILKQMRSALLKAIEQLREQGIIKHSLEASVFVYVDKDSAGANVLEELQSILDKKGQSLNEFFREFLIVSQFKVLPEKIQGLEPSTYEGLQVNVKKAEGTKCPRCWQWHITSDEAGLCQRCLEIVD